MTKIFTEQDRASVFDYILSASRECDKIVSLIQVGSGAYGYHDARSDLDFVAALDTGDSMLTVMDYIHRRISEKYGLAYFKQVEAAHLQVYVLDNLLEIDIGFGGYEGAAARKPAFKVLYDRTGVVEEKMVKSREWMDDYLYSDKQKKDKGLAADTVWSHLMHASSAIERGNFLRALGELAYVRGLYIDLLGDRYRLESAFGREIDRLPEDEKEAVFSTLVKGESREELRTGLYNLTRLIYKELEDCAPAVTQEMLFAWYGETN